VPLFETKTIGVILTNQIRITDIKARVGQVIEKCPNDILIEALARVQAVVDFEE
jgi:mRNA interferase ChpB